MQGLFIVILVLHLLISALLIVVVLIQQRTKGGMAGVFGGGGGGGGLGGAEQIFGSSGVAPFMTRITAILGAAFMVTTIALLLLPIGSVKSRPLINKPQATQTTGQAQGQVNETQTQPGLVIPPDTGAGGGK